LARCKDLYFFLKRIDWLVHRIMDLSSSNGNLPAKELVSSNQR